MNATALTSLWTYLQSLTLTANNKKWLADHLYESATREEIQIIDEDDLPMVTDDDFKLSPETLAMVSDLEPMDETEDYDEIRLKYLKEKYQS